jgi:hypothetical protein
VFRERFENTVKISSAPAQAVAFLVPYYPRNKHDVDCIEALWPLKLGLGLGDVEASWRELFPEIFDLGEEEVNVSFLHNWDKNSLAAIQGLSNERTSVNLAVLADVACNTSRADILVKM